MIPGCGNRDQTLSWAVTWAPVGDDAAHRQRGELWLRPAPRTGYAPGGSHAPRIRRTLERQVIMPNGRKRKRKKIATHKRKKRLRKNRHKKK